MRDEIAAPTSMYGRTLRVSEQLNIIETLRLLNAREDEDFEADNVFEQDRGTPLMAIWFG